MDWNRYKFYRFKRIRNKNYPANLSSIKCPTQNNIISIIIPVLNGEETIHQTIERITRQSDKDIEIITIDTGSDDRSLEILHKLALKDNRIKVFQNHDKTFAGAISSGFKIANGAFLTWISQATRVDSHTLETMMGELIEYPSVDIIFNHIPKRTHESEINPYLRLDIAYLLRDRVAWLLGDFFSFGQNEGDYNYKLLWDSLFTVKLASSRQNIIKSLFGYNVLFFGEYPPLTKWKKISISIINDYQCDFFLTPLVWTFMTDAQGSPDNRLIAELKKQINKCDHTLLEYDQFKLSPFTKLWLPTLYIFSTNSPDELLKAPSDLPINTQKILLNLSDGELPRQMDTSWDLCVSIHNHPILPRLRGEFQGWISVQNTSDLFNALDIRVRAAHLKQIYHHISHPEKTINKISVILCTYRWNDFLLKSLHSISRQSLQHADYEVIVVNNNPEDKKIKECVETIRLELYQEHPDQLKYIVCPIAGLSHARNAGISEATGEILCFIDDDAIADFNWIEHIYEAFQAHPHTGVIGGHVILVPPEPRPEVLHPGWEKYWSQFVTANKEYTDVDQWWEFPWGANWCARRQALVEIGGFRSKYGRRKEGYLGGEEVVAALLIQQLGYKIAVLPQAEVHHHVTPDRYSYDHVKMTILAGILTNYQEQIDLYLPMSMNFFSNTTKLAKLFFQLIYKYISPNRTDYEIKELIYRISANMTLYKSIINDFKRLFLFT